MTSYRDPFGRPIRWLYLKTDVLDRRCEGIMREFMNRRSGRLSPADSDRRVDPTARRARGESRHLRRPARGDSGADAFVLRPPSDCQDRGEHLSDAQRPSRANHRDPRIRPLWLHAPWWREGARLALGTGQGSDGAVWNCHRDNIVNARKTDWVEWQAGWVSGAILMPASALREWASEPAAKFGTNPPFALSSPATSALIKRVAEECDVSILAVQVRLSKLRLIAER